MTFEDKTKELYGDESFQHLRDIGALRVYYSHIVSLKEQLKIVTAEGRYNSSYKIQKAIAFWESMIKMVKAKDED